MLNWNLTLTPTDIGLRLLLAAALGMIIGYERERHGRSAGLRTQIVVAVSSCLLMILSLELQTLHRVLTADTIVRLDPSRIASYAVAGMGFMGAGAIIHGRGTVQGLTTAASLWLTNGLGLTVGAGFIIPAAGAAALALVALLFFERLQRRVPRDTYWRVYLDFDTCIDKMPEIEAMLREHSVRIIAAGFDCRFNSQTSSYEVAVRLKSTRELASIFEDLRKIEDLSRLRWTEGYVP
jgi:putative Mg2+ transporter-C (MgtC) family protein